MAAPFSTLPVTGSTMSPSSTMDSSVPSWSAPAGAVVSAGAEVSAASPSRSSAAPGRSISWSVPACPG